MSLAATATMVLMLLLLAGFWIIQTGLLAGLQFTEQKVEVVAYLQHDTRPTARSTRSRREIDGDARGGLGRVRHPRRGLARFRESLKAQGREDLTRYLDSNPLYASLEVKLRRPSRLGVVSERCCATSRSSATS